MEKQQTSTLWGGRFSESTDAFVQRSTASADCDRRRALLMLVAALVMFANVAIWLVPVK